MALAHGLAVVGGKRPAADALDHGFTGQFASALGAAALSLDACGIAGDSIVHLRVYTTDLSAYSGARPELADLCRQTTGGRLPPMTIVEVAGLLDGALVEIEATAERHRGASPFGDAAGEPGEEHFVASLRLRLAPSDARYAGGLVSGSKTMELFADLETEIALREGGDEGLCVAYDAVEFLHPLRVGDYVEARARVVSRGRRSRRLLAEVHKVIGVDDAGCDASPAVPILAARASATIVVGTAGR